MTAVRRGGHVGALGGRSGDSGPPRRTRGGSRRAERRQRSAWRTRAAFAGGESLVAHGAPRRHSPRNETTFRHRASPAGAEPKAPLRPPPLPLDAHLHTSLERSGASAFGATPAARASAHRFAIPASSAVKKQHLAYRRDPTRMQTRRLTSGFGYGQSRSFLIGGHDPSARCAMEGP